MFGGVSLVNMTTKKTKQETQKSYRKGPKELCVPVMRFHDNTTLDSKITVYDNINEVIIAATRDKLNLQLEKYRKIWKVQKNWQSYLGSAFSSGIALASVNQFRDIPFFPAAVCEATIKIVFFGSLFLSITSLFQLYKNRGKGSIDYLIEELKGLEMDDFPRESSQKTISLKGRVKLLVRGGDMR